MNGKAGIAEKKKLIFPAFAIVSMFLTGCGGMKEQQPASGGNQEILAEQEPGKERDTEEESSQEDGEENAYVYLAKRKIEDYNEKGTFYETYMPRRSEVMDGSAFYSEHGLYYIASVDSYGGADEIYDTLDDLYEIMLESYREPDTDYTDVKGSGILENGEDRYYILTGRGRYYDGTPFESRQMEYRQIQPSGASISWRLEMHKDYADSETDLILEELEKCYGISFAPLKTDSPLEPDTREQDDYKAKEGQRELEELEGYRYLGFTTLSDYEGEAICPVMIPKSRDTNVGEGHASSWLHGIQVTADVEEFYGSNILMTELKSSQDIRFESREGNTERIQNVWKSAMMPVSGYEDALYSVLSYEKKGNLVEDYFPRAEILMDIRFDEDCYLALAIYLSGEQYDDSTNKVIRELEQAYGLDLSEYYNQETGEDMAEATTESTAEDGEAAKAGEEAAENDLAGAGAQESGEVEEAPLTMAKLMGEVERTEEEILPDTILWFNATYAALTYSNGWNWKLVGGIKPTEENIEIEKYLLKSSWSVNDRESALEKAKWLKEEGHRQTCRECMEELEEMGLLELEEKEFQKKFLLSGLKSHPYRYVIAYNMYHAGQSEEAMAAWDLCRLNQMYASYYICGYMSYEEAMDASLENSLILQSMYSSWEEMMESYMLGYQFWQGESGKKEDSPTKERYRIYEMLQELEDSPYKLDWNMELQESW